MALPKRFYHTPAFHTCPIISQLYLLAVSFTLLLVKSGVIEGVSFRIFFNIRPIHNSVIIPIVKYVAGNSGRTISNLFLPQ